MVVNEIFTHLNRFLFVFKQLQEVCQQQFENGNSALEACLRRLPKALDQFLVDFFLCKTGVILFVLFKTFLFQSESESLEPPSPSPQILASPDVFTSYINSRIPFPATCGARFCSVGKVFPINFIYAIKIGVFLGILVCFGRIEAPNANVPTPTPRSYTSLLNHMREPRSYFTVKQDGGSLKSFYYPTREMRVRKICSISCETIKNIFLSQTPRKKPRVDSSGASYSARDNESSDESCSDLMVYDLSSVLPYSRELAKNYW